MMQMEVLQTLLPTPPVRIPSMLLRRPAMLQRPPSATARFISATAAALQLPAWSVARMVVGQPSLLGSSTAALQRRHARLQSCCAASRSWSRHMQLLPPGGLARVLTCPDSAFARLDLLVAAGLAGAPHLSHVKRLLTMSAAAFEALCETNGVPKALVEQYRQGALTAVGRSQDG